MPLVLIIAVIALALMYYNFRTTGLSRECRWRRKGEGVWECAFCGASYHTEGGKEPNICLRGQSKG